MSSRGLLRPFFLAGTAGPLFALMHEPSPDRARGEALIFVPPFGEEMNRSRRVVTLQAQALAELGYGVLVLDLFGTGDSAGDFVEATWEQWLDDIASAKAWLERDGGMAVGLWGLRLGASLAAAASSGPAGPCARLVLWEPVIRGETFLTQVLRTRIAAAFGREATRETTADMRRRLASGEALEVGGYVINPALAAAIDAFDLSAVSPRCRAGIFWLETAADNGAPLSPSARNLVEAWSAAGTPVTARSVGAPRFWTLIETTIAPGLVAATSQLLEGHAG